MAHIEDDFAAYTTIGDRVAPPPKPPASSSSPASQGPKFGVPSKLEPFTLLAKSARGSGAANLITQAVSAPGVYVFSELLQSPSINQLATNVQYAAHYKLLELFAYGTWGDYVGARDQYPTLTLEQETKLKQLTILSLASETRILPYSTLLACLDLSSIPQLEDLLIESIYSNIFTARLDQQARQLEILSSLGRDVKYDHNNSTTTTTSSSADPMQLDSSSSSSGQHHKTTTPASISSLLSSLQQWQTEIDTLLESLDSHLATLHANSVNQTHRQLEHERKVRDMVRDVAQGGGGGKQPHQGTANVNAASRGGPGGKGGGGRGGGGGGGGGHGTQAAASASSSLGSATTTSSSLSSGGWGGAAATLQQQQLGGESGGGGGGDMDLDSPNAPGGGGVTRNAISPGGGIGQRAKKRGRV